MGKAIVACRRQWRATGPAGIRYGRIEPGLYTGVTVTIAPARGDVGVLLAEWIRLDQGPLPVPAIVATLGSLLVRRSAWGEIPFEYHDSRQSRDLQ